MDDLSSREHAVANLIRAVVIAQMLGNLWVGITVIYHDAPDYFAHVKIRSLLMPIAVIALMFLFKLDKRIARLDSGKFFIFMGGIVSVSTALIAVTNSYYFYDVPRDIVTPSGQYGRATSPITLAIFAVGLIVYIVYAVRALRAQREASESPPSI